MPTLYRFFSHNVAIQALESLKLRVGRINSLNDPFDCVPYIAGCSNPHDQMIADGIMRKQLEDRNAELGLLCFSTTWRQTLLWSHYADSHRGVALVLRQKDSEMLWKVKYSKTRPVVQYSSLLQEGGERESIQAAMASFSVKPYAWRYEREIRIIRRLADCEVAGGHYFVELPKDAVAGVILGLRCEVGAEYWARVLAKSGLSKAKVWRTTRKLGFSLDRELT